MLRLAWINKQLARIALLTGVPYSFFFQISPFAIPLCLATPLSLLVIILYDLNTMVFPTPMMEHDLWYTWPAASCLYVAQIVITGFYIFKTPQNAMQRESNVSRDSNVLPTRP